jgi:hypothetical protein
MSSFHVLLSVSEQLRQTLWGAIHDDPGTRNLLASEMDLVFTNPTETARRRSSTNKLSMWLYQITENEYLKNQPPLRGNGHTSQQDPPLALNFYYLITPFGPTDGSPDAELLLLGKVMQVMYDNPTLFVQSPADNVFEELRVILCRLSLEELTRVWEALREPYRLSICYQVRVTRVDSSRIAQKARVVQADHDYGNTLDES